MDFSRNFEEVKVEAGQLVEKIKELIHEGNVRRIIIKEASGHTFMEVPLTVAAIGIIAIPILAAIAALAAMAADFTVVVERNTSTAAAAGAGPTPPPGSTNKP